MLMQSLPPPFVYLKPVQFLQGDTTAELIANANGWLQKGSPTRQLRGADTLLIEFFASADSELTKTVPYGSAALRMKDKEDFNRRSILNAVAEIIQVAKNNDVQVIVWVAVPCASGCRRKHVNNAKWGR